MLKDALPHIHTPLPGPKAKAILARREESIPQPIRCTYPCVIERGEGAMIEDVDGNVFLDWVGGVGVLNIGYSHPEVVEAIKQQTERYLHAMMNIVTHEGYITLAERLNALVPVRGETKRTMFANSGAEALENAVKVARAYTGRPNIIVFSGAFHGRTLLTTCMTAKKAYSAGTGPFPDGVYRADFPYLYRGPKGLTEEETIAWYIERFRKTLEEASLPEYIAAVVVEPVQGEGGFIPAPIEWVKAVRQICDEHGILLVADEVQTGFARSGKMFVSDYWAEAGCAPDILTMAKSIAAGVPLSAVTARSEIFAGVRAGVLGGTYGGNPLACVAALKVLEIMERDHLCARSLAIAKKCRTAFESWKDDVLELGDVRGIGCMMGLEFVTDRQSKAPNAQLVSAVVSHAAQRGLIIESAGAHGNVIRFLCPLVVTDEQLDAGLSILRASIDACRNH